jgi:hypothetical protein
MSPFEKKRNNPFFANEIAPDEVDESDHNTISVRDQHRPLFTSRSAKEISVLPVPPHTAYLDMCHSPSVPRQRYSSQT